MTVAIRPVVPADAPAIAAVYAPYVQRTVVTFEEIAPDADEMAARIATATATHPWLVAEADGALLGYAYGRPFHARAAYRWTAEAGVYLDRDRHGRGIGRALYAALFDRLAARGIVTVVALVTEPNPQSAGFHEATGFVRAGLMRGVGFKQGGWHDVGTWQRDLAPRPEQPADP